MIPVRSPHPRGVFPRIEPHGDVPQLPASGGGTPPTLNAITRNSGSTVGGATFQVHGSNFPTDAILQLAGANCTTVWNSSTQLTATSPAHAAGAVNAQVTSATNGNSNTLNNAFTYYTDAGTDHASSGFESGVVNPPFNGGTNNGGTITVDSAHPFTGTKSAHGAYQEFVDAVHHSGEGEVSLRPGANLPLNDANGTCCRWRIYVPLSTKQNSMGTNVPLGQNAQTKLHLTRKTDGQPPNGWFMLGIGTAFGVNGTLVIVRDSDTTTILNTGIDVCDGNIHEIQVWYTRKANLGTAYLWVDGNLIFSVTNSAAYGGDTAADDYWFSQGVPFCIPTDDGTHQNHVCECWVDDMAIRTGAAAGPCYIEMNA